MSAGPMIATSLSGFAVVGELTLEVAKTSES